VVETFGGGEGKLKGGAKGVVDRFLLRSRVILNFIISLSGGAPLGGILMLWEGLLLGGILKLRLGGMQSNVEFGYHLSICSRNEENHGKS
jgi:hypothetical protein